MNDKLKDELNAVLGSELEENEIDEVTASKEKDEKSDFEMTWYFIKNKNFKNFDLNKNVMVSEIGKTYKKKIFDEKGKPVLDENGNQKTEVIKKTWTEIAIPYTDRGEFIRVPNQRIKAASKNGFLYKVGINTKADHIPVFTTTGERFEKPVKKILSAFENNDKFIKEEIKKFHEKHDKAKEGEKEK